MDKKERTECLGNSYLLLTEFGEKKRGSVTYSTDRGDEVSEIFILSLLCA